MKQRKKKENTQFGDWLIEAKKCTFLWAQVNGIVGGGMKRLDECPKTKGPFGQEQALCCDPEW